MRVKIFVNKRWTASYKKAAFFFFRSALFVSLRGRRESLQPRQFRAKNRVFCLGSIFHRPIVESLFASLSLHRILIDQGENDPLNIRQKKNFTSKKYIFQNIYKTNYKTAITMITSPCSVLSYKYL